MVGTLVWFGRSIQDFFAPSSAAISVPSLVGQAEPDALDEIKRLHLASTILARQNSTKYPRGVVMEQQPPAGSRVREGRQVSLIVSTGVTIFPMPDIRYQSARNAGLELSRLKLQVVKQTAVVNEDVPAGFVVDENPKPLTSVHEGVTVSLDISRGPQGQSRAPNFIGASIDDARRAATEQHIRLGQIVWTPFGLRGPRRGEVVRQLPAPNTLLDAFQPVSLQVSAGPGETGYLVRQVHAEMTVPVHDQTARIRIQMRDGTGTWNLYDAYAQGGQRLDFNVTAVGTAVMETYVNNELRNQTQIGVEPPRPSPTPGPYVRDTRAIRR
jgi:serine/threonine-protein kinase